MKMFEKNLNRLEEIIRAIECDEPSLDSFVNLYREAKDLHMQCIKDIKAAKLVIENINNEEHEDLEEGNQ